MSIVNTSESLKRTAFLNLDQMEGAVKLGGMRQPGELDQFNARITSASKSAVNFETGGVNDGIKVAVTTNGSVKIDNKATGEQYEIWGDPHGRYWIKNAQTGESQEVHFGDLKRDSTFEFGGVKITLGMTDLKNGVNYVDKFTITAGDYGAVVTGVAPDKANTKDFTVSEYRGSGGALDRATDDGVRYVENNTERDGSRTVINKGLGFLVMDGKTKALVYADQKAIDAAEKADAAAKAKAAAATGTGIPAVDRALSNIASNVAQAQQTAQALRNAPAGSAAGMVPNPGALDAAGGVRSSHIPNLENMSYREIGIMLAAIMKEKQDEATELAKKMGKDPKNVNPEDQAKLQALQSDVSMLGQVVAMVKKAIEETDRNLLS